MKIFAERQLFSDSIAIHMADRTEHGQWVAKPVILEKVEPGQITEPVMSLPMTAAQNLMDELWHCGLRPSEGSGSAGSLAATERHLADMKALAFHALKVKA